MTFVAGDTPSKIPNLLDKLRHMHGTNAAYLGYCKLNYSVLTVNRYTATPHANILQPKDDPLFPDFIWVLERHPEAVLYQGAEFFFGELEPHLEAVSPILLVIANLL